MKRPLIPRPRRATPFMQKFGRDTEFFGSRKKPEPPPKTYLPMILFCLVGGLILCLAISLLGLLPKVRNVTAKDGRIYSAEVLVHYADIESGDLLWGFDSASVAKQMREYMPLLDTIRVRKHLNGDVSIRVTEHENLYYTCHNRNYYVFTADELRVLCVRPTDSEARQGSAVYIGLPESARVRVGETVTFINLPYASDTTAGTSGYEAETEEPEVENAYVMTFVEAVMKSPFADRVMGMELSDRYDLWLVLEGSVRVSVGDMSELADKLSIAHRALEERGLSAGSTDGLPVSVDVSDPARIVFRSSPDIDIPDWGRP